MAKSRKKRKVNEEGKKMEKKFFMWATIITLLLIGILYMSFIRNF